MKKILVISTHANLYGKNTHGDINPSFANTLILDQLAQHDHIFIHDLLTAYPDGVIDVEKEQSLLCMHDAILMMGPMYWYTLPAIAKQWIDEVLVYGWAYGSKGNALVDKDFYLAITAASKLEEFTADDLGYSLKELLSPIELTVEYCKMKYHPILFLGGITSKSKNEDLLKIKAKINVFSSQIIQQISSTPNPSEIKR